MLELKLSHLQQEGILLTEKDETSIKECFELAAPHLLHQKLEKRDTVVNLQRFEKVYLLLEEVLNEKFLVLSNRKGRVTDSISSAHCLKPGIISLKDQFSKISLWKLPYLNQSVCSRVHFPVQVKFCQGSDHWCWLDENNCIFVAPDGRLMQSIWDENGFSKMNH